LLPLFHSIVSLEHSLSLSPAWQGLEQLYPHPLFGPLPLWRRKEDTNCQSIWDKSDMLLGTLCCYLSLSLSPQALERLYKHPLFGPLPVFITSNIECQLFPQPHPINMKIWIHEKWKIIQMLSCGPIKRIHFLLLGLVEITLSCTTLQVQSRVGQFKLN
jgi:hypothetical protein